MKKPVWKKNKGIKLIRYGGLSPVKQTNRAAPVDRGLWAFVFPYFDLWYLTGSFSKDKWEHDETGCRISPRRECRKIFWHSGDLFTRFNIPGSVAWNRGNGWYLTTDRDLYDYLNQHAPDFLKEVVSWRGSLMPNRTNPFSVPNNLSLDCLEVFVPKFPIRRS